MKLSKFITDNIEEILAEWEAFAKTLLPAAADMSAADLRDDAKEILCAIALDLETDQTAREQTKKSKGATQPLEGGAAELHGALRQASGFTLAQLVAEYRALRASVLRLWQEQSAPCSPEVIDDLMRFNESVDQSLAASIEKYSQHAQNTRDTFLAILGHDLRTPLQNVSLAAEYLAKPGVQQAGLDRTSTRLRLSAARMTAMIHDLIEYSRAQLGDKMRLVHRRHNFKELAQAALLDANAAYPECPFELEASGDLSVSVDGARVHQMLTNLLTNAAQSRDKAYSVTLTVAGEPDQLVVRVKNRGPVIAAEFFEAIFNPLVQLTNLADDSSRPATSLGLGLHIARTIAVAHCGDISVTSTQKNGTVFTVRLPRDQRNIS
ncbi:MAG: putative two-component sensor histidine kinase [Ramlibacter sp.]|nr:putative two-component sensor histidine kinase [Ramlibacter sp.]